MKRSFLSLLGLVFGYLAYQLISPGVLAAYGVGFQDWVDLLFTISVLLLLGSYFGLSVLDARRKSIYTDGTYVVSASAVTLQRFMEHCQLAHLSCNNASFTPYYHVPTPEHLKTILENGAKLLTTYQLSQQVAGRR